jgi:hypothetical protein
VFGGTDSPSRRAQRFEAFRCFLQRRLEAADAEARQRRLHPVGDAAALSYEARALAVRAFGILLRQRRDGRHAAVAGLAAQPAEEGALEQPGVEPVRLRPAMLARYGDAGRMDDVRLDAVSP